MTLKKLYFTSLGCSRNLVDSEVMLSKLLIGGYQLIDSIKKADVFVINTCGFLKEARDEAYDILDEIFDNKKKRAKVVLTGCMVKLHLDEIKDKYPDIHSIIGAGDIENIIKSIDEKIIITENQSFIQKQEPRVLTTPEHLAYLKIAEGCKKACSFCVIPKIKGPLRSRSEDDILKEFHSLLDQGVFEIVLIAQDLMDFGRDRSENNALVNLIKKMLQSKKDFWLRLLYVYPDEVTDEFIDLIKSDSRICKYLDIPIQHINDDILQSMRRKTSKKQIISIYEKLKKIENFSIRSSLMVGYPNETDAQFEELLQFIQDYPIDNLGIFKYSNEKHAYSSTLENQIDEEIKNKRFEKLSLMQLELSKKRNQNLIGKNYNVIIDGYHEDSEYLINARHQGQAYDVDSKIIINDVSKVDTFSKIYNIKITNFLDYDLIAEVSV